MVQNEIIDLSPNECYATTKREIILKTNESYSTVNVPVKPSEYEEIDCDL